MKNSTESLSCFLPDWLMGMGQDRVRLMHVIFIKYLAFPNVHIFGGTLSFRREDEVGVK
jgi:hypothetical protein